MLSDEQFLEWLESYPKIHRYAPSVREVSALLATTDSTAHRRLRQLRDQSKITWNEGEARTLRVMAHGT